MSDFSKRVEGLSDDKRELLEMFLKEKRVDRKWLSEDFVAPRNAVEEALATIWQEVLGVEQVGIHDNFFELGGDSIVSIQIVAKALQAGLAMESNQDLFERPTIAELAPLLAFEQPQSTRGGSEPAAREPAPPQGDAADFPDSGLSQDELDELLS